MNQQYIDGSWYENEYKRKWYRHQYIDTDEPIWAKESNEYYIGLKIAYTGIKPAQKILDLGSSVGRYMRAWKRMGFRRIKGLEISAEAIENAESGCEIYQGSAADMHMFDDKEFDLVQSAALFEHIDESILDDVLKECFRVGKMQAHTIGLEYGSDPSHINIKSMDEWVDRFNGKIDNDKSLVGYMPDTIFQKAPILLAIHEDDLTYPMITLCKDTTEEHENNDYQHDRSVEHMRQ